MSFSFLNIDGMVSMYSQHADIVYKVGCFSALREFKLRRVLLFVLYKLGFPEFLEGGKNQDNIHTVLSSTIFMSCLKTDSSLLSWIHSLLLHLPMPSLLYLLCTICVPLPEVSSLHGSLPEGSCGGCFENF